jgi:hypothetical protein
MQRILGMRSDKRPRRRLTLFSPCGSLALSGVLYCLYYRHGADIPFIFVVPRPCRLDCCVVWVLVIGGWVSDGFVPGFFMQKRMIMTKSQGAWRNPRVCCTRAMLDGHREDPAR